MQIQRMAWNFQFSGFCFALKYHRFVIKLLDWHKISGEQVRNIKRPYISDWLHMRCLWIHSRWTGTEHKTILVKQCLCLCCYSKMFCWSRSLHVRSYGSFSNTGSIARFNAPDGPHVGPMNLAIRVLLADTHSTDMCYYICRHSDDKVRDCHLKGQTCDAMNILCRYPSAPGFLCLYSSL